MKEIKFFVLVTISAILAIMALYIPPQGVIDKSVLIGISLFISLAAGVIECVIHLDFKNLYFHLGKMDKSINYKEKETIQKTEQNENTPKDV